MDCAVVCFLDSFVNGVVGAFFKYGAVSGLDGILGLCALIVCIIDTLDRNGDIELFAASLAVFVVCSSFTVKTCLGCCIRCIVYLLENRL